MSFYLLDVSVTLFGIFLCISDVESMRTLTNVVAKHGGSVTVPCLYDEQYKANPKFWCKGYLWSSCEIVAYANSKEASPVTDYPAQNMLTVDLNPVSDSGSHWCAAEIGSQWKPDDRAYFYVTVRKDPELSVMESRVGGEEGGSITIQCLYSAVYQKKQKQWCRFKDRSCQTVSSTGTSQNSAVHISDDGKKSFTVVMSELKKSDAGWYWCSAEDLQVPVHISVGDESPESRNVSGWMKDARVCLDPRNSLSFSAHTLITSKQIPGMFRALCSTPYQSDRTEEAFRMGGETSSRIFNEYTILVLCVISGLLLVLVVVGLVIWKLKQKHTGLLVTNKGHSRTLASSASEPDVTYSTVGVSHHPSVSSDAPNDKVIYSPIKHS